MSVLSENLRYLRHSKDLSQKQLGDRLGITRARYAKYEEGPSEPPIEILKKISAYYRISIELLVSADLHRVSQDEINAVESIVCKFRTPNP